MVEELHTDIYLLGRYGAVSSGAWLFVAGKECALFEAPEHGDDEYPPVALADDLIGLNDLRLRYVVISHPHRDHVDSLQAYKRRFPRATFVAHKTASYILHGQCTGRLVTEPDLWRRLPSSDDLFDHLYDESIQLPLGDHVIHQVHAPKHSPGDTITWFRQVLFTGDWWLYEGDPGNCREVQRASDGSVRKVLDYLAAHDLEVRHVFPSHANNLLYDIDIREVLGRSLRSPGTADAPWCQARVMAV